MTEAEKPTVEDLLHEVGFELIEETREVDPEDWGSVIQSVYKSTSDGSHWWMDRVIDAEGEITHVNIFQVRRSETWVRVGPLFS